MRLFAAELLKMRRRTMTYVLLITLLVVMAFIFLVVGSMIAPELRQVRGAITGLDLDPIRAVHAIVGDFVFGGLGSLLAVIYAGAIVGADHTWGVLRNPLARGESREMYMLAKAAALGVVIAIGAAIAFVAGEAMILLVATSARVDLGNLLTADALLSFVSAYGLGLLVLLERAAIAFAVAVVLRSQLAGIVVAAVLYIAEPIIANIAAALALPARIFDPQAGLEPHWSQFFPFSVGSSVLNQGYAALPALVEGFVPNIELGVAVAVVVLYLVSALAVSVIVVRRQEIT